MEQNKNIIPADATVDGPAGASGKATIPNDATVGEPVSRPVPGKAIIPQDATIGVHDSPVQQQKEGGFLHALKQAFFLEPQDPGAINWHNPMPGDITPEALQSIAPKGINAGAEKGLTETLSGTSQLLGKAKRFVTGESDQTKADLITGEHHPTGIFGEAPATAAETDAVGTQEQIGKTAESIVEWMAGEAAFKALTKAQKIAKALELAKGPAATLVEKYPTLAKFLFKPAAKIAGGAVSGAAVGGTLEGLKSGGDVNKTLQGAESGALFGAGTEVLSSAGQIATKAGNKLFQKAAQKVLQEPLNKLSDARMQVLKDAAQKESEVIDSFKESPKTSEPDKSGILRGTVKDETPKLKPEYQKYFDEHGQMHPDIQKALDDVSKHYADSIEESDANLKQAWKKIMVKAAVTAGAEITADKIMDNLGASQGTKWAVYLLIGGAGLKYAKGDVMEAFLQHPNILQGVAKGTLKVDDLAGSMGTFLRNKAVKSGVKGALFSANSPQNQ
jgi:hypothetical protein